MHVYDPVFARVSIDHLVAGGSRVSWEMYRHFIDPGPYSFQLQVSHVGLENADDWDNVGIPVIDTYFKVDSDKRLFGKTLETHYRVELTTSVDTYYSQPQKCDGNLSKYDWLIARELTRKEFLRHRVLTSVNGYLLKVRRYGPRCLTCTDEFTEEVNNAKCPDCFGTGFENGYYEPLAAVYADLGLDKGRDHRNPNLGMEKQDVISARFIGDPHLYSYDAWVNLTSDERYYMHTLEVIAQHRGVALVYNAELRLAPFSDIIYTVPLSASFAAPKPKIVGEMICLPKQNSTLGYLEAMQRKARSFRH